MTIYLIHWFRISSLIVVSWVEPATLSRVGLDVIVGLVL